MATITNIAAAPSKSSYHRLDPAHLKRRHRSEWFYRTSGFTAILIGISFLCMIITSIVWKGWSAFLQTNLTLEVFLDKEQINPDGRTDLITLHKGNYRQIARNSLYKQLGFSKNPPLATRRQLNKLLSRGVDVQIRDYVLSNPSVIGQTIKIPVLAHGNVDAFMKGSISRNTPSDRRQLNDQQVEWVDKLHAGGALYRDWNWGLFRFGASSQPETSGLRVAIIGSFFMMLIVIVLAVPLGVAAAAYLEEFAPKNWITDIIEVNINNLAAVPSIVFGLLGLSVFINIVGLPRSASLVGGLVLTLMTLPTVIIATRASIRAVPPSIREAAFGVGASKMQTLFHHTMPLAFPGVLTGTIIGLVQALGETAPLLMIGLVAFVVDAPSTPLDPSTALPVQIYMWATSAERGFVERTAGATIVLLAFLIIMNAVAIILRRHFERRW